MSYVRNVLLRGWIEGALGLVAWVGSVLAAQWLIEQFDSPGDSHWALVILLLPVTGLMILLWTMARDLKRRDEMEQRFYGLAAIVTLFALITAAVVYEFYQPLFDWPDVAPVIWAAGAWIFWWVCFRVIRRFHLI